ncbi:hypothetical protein F4802DRAFT_311433 [Xylaria palmicola]|nr:hypothetical protein F4802DRAFT_311433 [Xylaria palmicola]
MGTQWIVMLVPLSLRTKSELSVCIYLARPAMRLSQLKQIKKIVPFRGRPRICTGDAGLQSGVRGASAATPEIHKAIIRQRPHLGISRKYPRSQNAGAVPLDWLAEYRYRWTACLPRVPRPLPQYLGTGRYLHTLSRFAVGSRPLLIIHPPPFMTLTRGEGLRLAPDPTTPPRTEPRDVDCPSWNDSSNSSLEYGVDSVLFKPPRL